MEPILNKNLFGVICHELGHALAFCKRYGTTLYLDIEIIDSLEQTLGHTRTFEEQASDRDIFVLQAGFVMESIVKGRTKVVQHRGTDTAKCKAIGATATEIKQAHEELFAFLTPYKDSVIKTAMEFEQQARATMLNSHFFIECGIIHQIYNHINNTNNDDQRTH